MSRRRAGLSQRELAERLGLRQATIARWERGDRRPSFEDAEAAARACGLQIDAHIALEDRSWWPQIAAQLDFSDPLERVRRLTRAGSSDLAGRLESFAATDPPVIVIGEVAGALQGWPLALNTQTIDVCARATVVPPAVAGVTITRARASRARTRIDRAGAFVGVIGNMANQEPDALPEQQRDA
jgi:transcriptional regulator with XRE-family HTH domain